MKKITTLPFLFTILICIYACADYKPIFGSANLQFEIADQVRNQLSELGVAIEDSAEGTSWKIL